MRALADRNDLEFTYSLIDRMFRLSLGEIADFSGAKYDGDFTLTLEEAQRAQTRVHRRADRDRAGPTRPGPRVRVGTVAQGRARSRRRRGRRHPLLCAVRGVSPPRARRPPLRRTTRRGETFGPFDAVASLGAFEHFCSPEEYTAGRQETIYCDLFANVAGVLPDEGRFYLQTMVFGPNMIPLADVDIDAPRESDALVPRPARTPVPGLVAPARAAPDRQVRGAALPTGGGSAADSTTSRPSGSGGPVRRAELQEVAAQAAARATVAHQLRLPAGLHLGREREQRLLRAGAARALSPRLRESLE